MCRVKHLAGGLWALPFEPGGNGQAHGLRAVSRVTGQPLWTVRQYRYEDGRETTRDQ